MAIVQTVLIISIVAALLWFTSDMPAWAEQQKERLTPLPASTFPDGLNETIIDAADTIDDAAIP